MHKNVMPDVKQKVVLDGKCYIIIDDRKLNRHRLRRNCRRKNESDPCEKPFVKDCTRCFICTMALFSTKG